MYKKNYHTFLDRVASDLKIEATQIIDFELAAFDAQKPDITGLFKEFLSSPRLDNLASSYASLDALIDLK